MSKTGNRVLKWFSLILAVLAAGLILYQVFVGFVVFQWIRETESDVSPTNLFRSVTFPVTNALGHRTEFGAMGGFEEWYCFGAGKDAREWLINQRQLQQIPQSQVPKRFWQAGPTWWQPAGGLNLQFYTCKCSWDYGGDGDHICLAFDESTGHVYYRYFFRF